MPRRAQSALLTLLPADVDPPQKDDGHAEVHGVILTALAIALGLVVWSVIGAHTSLY